MDATVPARPKLLDQMRDKLRVLHYAWKTEKSYVAWVERFLRFHKERRVAPIAALGYRGGGAERGHSWRKVPWIFSCAKAHR